MIKEIVKRALLYFAIISLMVYLVSFILFSKTGEYRLILQILILSAIIAVIQYASGFLKSNNYIGGLIIEYILTSGFVLFYGFFVGWFVKENWYMVFGYVAVVYIVAILLDIVRVKKDVDFINSALEERRKENEKR